MSDITGVKLKDLLFMIKTTGSIMNSFSEPAISHEELRVIRAELNTLRLLCKDKISPDEYRRMDDMIHSPDTENLIVAEEAIKNLIKDG